MKKLLYTVMGLAALATTASSCSQDADVAAPGETTVTLTIKTPDPLTRAGSVATTANRLQYAVFELSASGDRTLVEQKSAEQSFAEPFTLDLRLLTGHQYGLLFWADNSAAPYSVNLKGGTVSVDYTQTLANDANLEAFYAYKTVSINGNTSLAVTLERPVAMIAIGANSQPEAGAQSSVTVADAPSQLNLFTGAVSGNEDATFGNAEIPTDLDYPVSGYWYVAYAYVLAPQQPQTDYTVTYTYDGKSKEVEGVSLQANYRTNIYGSLP